MYTYYIYIYITDRMPDRMLEYVPHRIPNRILEYVLHVCQIGDQSK